MAFITSYLQCNYMCSFPLVGGSKPAGHHDSIVSTLSRENVEAHCILKTFEDSECSSGQEGVVSPSVEDNEVCV